MIAITIMRHCAVSCGQAQRVMELLLEVWMQRKSEDMLWEHFFGSYPVEASPSVTLPSEGASISSRDLPHPKASVLTKNEEVCREPRRITD